MGTDSDRKLTLEDMVQWAVFAAKLLDVYLSVDENKLKEAMIEFGKPVYEFSVSSDEGAELCYRSRDLFGKKAVLLNVINLAAGGVIISDDEESEDDDFDSIVFEPPCFSYNLEIWLLEDFDCELTSCYRVQVEDTPEYAEYRVSQTVETLDVELSFDDFDFDQMKRRLQELCRKIKNRAYPLIEKA